MLKIKIIKIAVVALCIPAAKVTSHIISKKSMEMIIKNQQPKNGAK